LVGIGGDSSSGSTRPSNRTSRASSDKRAPESRCGAPSQTTAGGRAPLPAEACAARSPVPPTAPSARAEAPGPASVPAPAGTAITSSRNHHSAAGGTPQSVHRPVVRSNSPAAKSPRRPSSSAPGASRGPRLEAGSIPGPASAIRNDGVSSTPGAPAGSDAGGGTA